MLRMVPPGRRRLGLIAWLVLLAGLTLPWSNPGVVARAARVVDSVVSTSFNGHYFYTFPDGNMYVYAMDQNFALVKHVTNLPTSTGTRGIAVDPSGHALYLSYGGDGGGNGNGSLLKYDLLTDTILWTRNYAHGVDSMSLTPDGSTIYMPDGEEASDGNWWVVNASDGSETGVTIDTQAGTGDCGPHNTIVSLDGTHVYLGDRDGACTGSYYFYVASTATNQVTRRVGPFQSGIRPFTINGGQTLVYTSVTGFIGFQVGDLTTGRVLYTVPAQGFTNVCTSNCPTDPSHGLSLSPDERELYLIDYPNNYVHVFDVSNVPASAPLEVADLPVTAFSPQQHPCAYDCIGEGWLLHSRDGKYVFVGDSGDVIDTATRARVTNLATLSTTREFIEIDWQKGTPVATTTRQGLGYVTGQTAPTLTPTRRGTVTPTAAATTSNIATVTPTPTATESPAPGRLPRVYLPVVPHDDSSR